MSPAFQHRVDQNREPIDFVSRSERHRAARERFYRALVDQALDIISVVGSDGTIVFESQSIERVLGYAPHELVGRNAFDFVHPDDVDRVKAAFTAAKESGEASPLLEFRFRDKNGGWRVLEGIGRTMYGVANEPLGIVHSRDITERKRLEDRVRQAQKLEAVGRMTGAIAHDFNNLLMTIVAHANVIIECSDSASTRDSLTQILAAVERATRFTHQLLAYSHGGELRRTERTSVHDALDDLVTMLAPVLDKVRLERVFAARSAVVSLDQGLFGQVAMNLLINARDAMPRGGLLTIATSNVTRRTGARAIEYLVLAVSDTGTGMTADVRLRAFEPFFTTKESGKGSGLGLPTVLDIVRQASGFIELDSEEGAGTTFRVLLPVVRP